ncbi:MAG: hypothetical protein GC159_13100 [Phycisphaera sp.]|nr:hypothetical protein [Phycisphaera sp.]
MNPLNWIQRAWSYVVMRPTSPIGLAFFRILYGLVLLTEIGQLYFYRHLIFDSVPYLKPAEIDIGPALLLWMGVVAMLVVGWQTRAAALTNYVMTVLTFGSFTLFEYHVDYIYTSLGLLLLFLPVSHTGSIDAWLMRRRGTPYPSQIPIIFCNAVIWLGVGLVYMDSVCYKWSSPMWTSGLGLWLPASRPHITWVNASLLLDLKPVVVFLGYVTLLFETVFPLFFWWDRAKPACLMIGIGLHLGVAIIFPIPLFGLAVVAIYLAMAPPAWLNRVIQIVRVPPGVFPEAMQLDMRSDEDVPGDGVAPTNNRSPALTSLRASAITVVIVTVVMTASQVLVMSQSMLARRLASDTGLSRVRTLISDVAARALPATRPLAGVTHHPVFMDTHFTGYDQVLTVRYIGTRSQPETTPQWLPILRSNGVSVYRPKIVTGTVAQRTWTRNAKMSMV